MNNLNNDLLDSLNQQAQEINNDSQKQIKNQLLEMNPFDFEKFITQLFIKMNYTNKNGKGITTKKTNDGGIDSIIYRDELGLDKIYIQVKRFKNTISSPLIDQFIGALRNHHAKYGVFVTTSDFSNTAKVNATNNNITLINGNRLIKLMIKYNIGVINHIITISQIDNNYFTINKPQTEIETKKWPQQEIKYEALDMLKRQMSHERKLYGIDSFGLLHKQKLQTDIETKKWPQQEIKHKALSMLKRQMSHERKLYGIDSFGLLHKQKLQNAYLQMITAMHEPEVIPNFKIKNYMETEQGIRLTANDFKYIRHIASQQYKTGARVYDKKSKKTVRGFHKKNVIVK